jgi:DNA invertase Pin-like site-specific DNA recombinase
MSCRVIDFNLTNWTEAAMKGQRIGYVRVSTFDQNVDRQLEGPALDRIFTDKASGKDVNRPQLDAMLTFAREGDTVVVHSMDRLAISILDSLRKLVHRDQGKRMTFSGEDSPMANLMLSVMGAFAEFERALIRERQREGIAIARQRGAYRGRKRSLSDEKLAELHRRVAAGERKAVIARDLGISRETLYQYLRAAY